MDGVGHWGVKIYLLNSWMMGEECKPIIIRDGDKSFHFVSRVTLCNLCMSVPDETLSLTLLRNA